jgi:O-antigen/teichoic acid export membrane protein
MIRKFFFLLGARGFRELFQTAFLIYLARQNTKTYGEFIFAIGLGGVLLVMSEFGLNQYLTAALSRSRGSGDRMITRVTLVKGGFFILGWLGIYLVLWLQNYPLRLLQVVLIIAAGAGLEAVSNTFFTALQFHGRQKQEAVIKSVASAAGFGYGLAAAFLGAPAVTIAFFKLIDGGIGSLMSLAVLVRGGRFRPSRPAGTWRLILSASIFGFLQIAAILSNRVNLFFLERFGGSEKVAFYGAPWQIIDGVAAIFSVLFVQSILYPAFSRIHGQDPERAAGLARRTARWLMLLAIPLMFFLSVEADRLISLIYGAGYERAVWIQNILALIILFSFFQNLGTSLLMGMGLEKGLLVIYLAGLGIHTALCVLIIPTAPLKGAVASILAGKVAVALWILCRCQKRLALLSKRSVIELLLAVGMGMAAYILMRTYLLRELVECLSMVPVLFLAWTWYRRDRT